MRIDLHTHSLASDGTDTPGDLVRAARRAGLDVVALTDHDTAQGWDEAAAAAAEVGITLIRGMEISTLHQGRSMHLLAYLLDPGHPELVAALEHVLEGRSGRVPAIVAALRRHGIEITVDDVLREADASMAAGRPHVADALVRLGVVGDRTEGFRLWLNPGRPGYVSRQAPELGDMVEVVSAAGGVAVLAHAWGRGRPPYVGADDLAALRDRGLGGLEVDHQDHTPEEREQLRRIARDLDLVVTGSSDHHGTGKVDHDLGVNLTAPAELDRLLQRAEAAATASACEVPEVLVH